MLTFLESASCPSLFRIKLLEGAQERREENTFGVFCHDFGELEKVTGSEEHRSLIRVR
jgi:hypothetical protein